MSDRQYRVVIGVMSIILVAQVVLLAAESGRSGDAGDPALLFRATHGARVEALVQGPDGAHTALSDLAPGRCVFAVVYSPTCGPSIRAAGAWTRMTHAEGIHSIVPSNWVALWLSVEDSASSAAALAPDFPFARYFRATAERLEPALGLRAYPAHVVLDRLGRVVTGGIGAPLPTPDQLSPACEFASAN